MRGREKFEKLKPIINILVKLTKILPMKLRIKRFYRLRGVRGNYGILIRYVYLKSISPSCGGNVSVHEGVYLLNPDKIILGNNVSIHPMCYIDAAGIIRIGNDVSIAHAATIMSSTHEYEALDVPIKDQGVALKETTICDNVWLGAKSTILAGTVVKSGSVVGGGAVVTKDTAENSVVAGVPAKPIKNRSAVNGI